MRINGLVTLYNPEPETIEFWRKKASEFDQIFLCDNTKENLGIPLAYNKILKKEPFENDDILLFFDQDTRFEPDYVRKLVNAFETAEVVLKNKGLRIGVMGPAFYNRSRKAVEKPHIKEVLEINGKQLNELYFVNSIITSSMITRFSTIKDIGYWNEDLFLDFADWDLCFRLVNGGYTVCMLPDLIINHEVGEGDKKIGFMEIRKSSPEREYYMARDSRYMLSRKYTPRQYRRKLVQMAYFEPIIHSIVFDCGLKRLRFTWDGVNDYKAGVTGVHKSCKFM